MRVAVTLSPTGDWLAILRATRIADAQGLDAVGFWDHYHSERPQPPRVVVGVGGSRRLLRSAVTYADELNVYSDDGIVAAARAAIAQAGRPIDLSVFINWERWPDDVGRELTSWDERGVDRV